MCGGDRSQPWSGCSWYRDSLCRGPGAGPLDVLMEREAAMWLEHRMKDTIGRNKGKFKPRPGGFQGVPFNTVSSRQCAREPQKELPLEDKDGSASIPQRRKDLPVQLGYLHRREKLT